jgi:hypothetical protein
MNQDFFDEQSEQSEIKAAIVADYFWAWANVIIGSQNKYSSGAQKIAYIDLFAGPGRYRNAPSTHRVNCKLSRRMCLPPRQFSPE